VAGVINKKKPSGGTVYSTEPHSGEGSPLDAAETNALAGVLRYPNNDKALYPSTDSAKLRSKKMAWRPFFYSDGNAKNALPPTYCTA